MQAHTASNGHNTTLILATDREVIGELNILEILCPQEKGVAGR